MCVSLGVLDTPGVACLATLLEIALPYHHIERSREWATGSHICRTQHYPLQVISPQILQEVDVHDWWTSCFHSSQPHHVAAVKLG